MRLSLNHFPGETDPENIVLVCQDFEATNPTTVRISCGTPCCESICNSNEFTVRILMECIWDWTRTPDPQAIAAEFEEAFLHSGQEDFRYPSDQPTLL